MENYAPLSCCDLNVVWEWPIIMDRSNTQNIFRPNKISNFGYCCRVQSPEFLKQGPKSITHLKENRIGEDHCFCVCWHQKLRSITTAAPLRRWCNLQQYLFNITGKHPSRSIICKSINIFYILQESSLARATTLTVRTIILALTKQVNILYNVEVTYNLNAQAFSRVRQVGHFQSYGLSVNSLFVSPWTVFPC